MLPIELVPFAIAAATAVLTGAVRGFAGFGSAMLMTPVFAALFGPPVGVAVCLLLEFALALPLLRRAVKLVDWRRIALLLAAAALAIPFGTWLLLHADPGSMRWAISLIVLAAALMLAMEWRLRSRPGVLATAAAGGLSGFLNGLSGMAGPPITLYYLAGVDSAPVIRASFLVYFAAVDLLTIAVFAIGGAVSGSTLGIALVLVPFSLAGGLLGERLFALASEAFYRRLALALLFAVAIGSLLV